MTLAELPAIADHQFCQHQLCALHITSLTVVHGTMDYILAFTHQTVKCLRASPYPVLHAEDFARTKEDLFE